MALPPARTTRAMAPPTRPPPHMTPPHWPAPAVDASEIGFDVDAPMEQSMGLPPAQAAMYPAPEATHDDVGGCHALPCVHAMVPRLRGAARSPA